MPKRAVSSPVKPASSPTSAVATKQQVAKKARIEQKPASPEATVIATLATASHLPKQCRDILQVSLPYCFATASADRHKFQLEFLGSAQRIFEDMEVEKRKQLNEEEFHLDSVQAEKDAAVAEREAKAESAAGKKKQCDEKHGQVDEATKAVETASNAVKAAQNRREDCMNKKSKLLSEVADFQALLSTSYQPLKDGSFGSTKNDWRKRNKIIAEFLQKVGAATNMEDCLLDAMEMLLKTRPDQRKSFAQTTLEFAEKAFDDHTQKLSQEIPVLDEQATVHEKEIEADEAVLSDKKSHKESVEKEWDEAQREWVDLDTAALTAKGAVQTLELKIDEVQARVNLAKQTLEDFLKISAEFARLKEPAETEPEASSIQQREAAKQPENIIEERSEANHVEAPVGAEPEVSPTEQSVATEQPGNIREERSETTHVGGLIQVA